MKKNEGNYTQVPNIILDDATLDVYEFRILSHIARQTIGYGKKNDGISLSQFRKATGISVAKVHATVTTLKEKKYIKVTQQTAKSGGKSYNKYSLTLIHSMDNPLYMTWIYKRKENKRK
jgi:phage replication O-like protein O